MILQYQPSNLAWESPFGHIKAEGEAANSLSIGIVFALLLLLILNFIAKL